METGDNAIAPMDVELTGETDTPLEKNPPKQMPLVVDGKISFRTHVGWDGVLWALFSVGVAGLFVYVTFLYTKEFGVWHRPGAWVFIVFAVLYTLLPLWLLFMWRGIATRFDSKIDIYKPKQEHGRTQKKGTSFVRKIFNARKLFRIDGSLFLWKLYLLELTESVNQIINLATLYVCTLPVQITSSMSVFLCADAFYRAYQLNKPNTSVRRLRQVKLDLFVDFVCLTAPLCVLWFRYQTPISIPEMIQITAWPSLCILSKLKSILRNGVKARAANAILLQQSNRLNNRSKSIDCLPYNAAINKQQEQWIPKVVSRAFSVYNVICGVSFLVVAVAHVAMQPSGCDEKTWSKGCSIKIPFCHTMFKPTCNCVSLKIENDKNLTTLPSSLAEEMSELRRVFIHNCNLTKLPPKMEQLTEMVDFQVSFNHLEEFMVDVLKWKKLSTLFLMYNNITKYNAQAIWTHPHLVGLALERNHLEMPTSRLYLPSLTFLHLGENNMTINKQINIKSLPNIAFLYLNGNNLGAVPSESLRDQLSYLGIARCNLKSLPAYTSRFRNLQYLDARDNSIENVDNDLKDLLRRNKVESYFSGNPVCIKDGSLDCAPLCSKTCWSRKVGNDDECDVSCSSKDCRYDGGDCQRLE